MFGPIGADMVYLSERLGQQFYGFLVADYQAENLNPAESPLRLTRLPGDARMRLRAAHEDISEVIRVALEPFQGVQPVSAFLVDPYAPRVRLDSEDLSAIERFSPEPLKELGTAFRDHPAVAVALATPNEISRQPSRVQRKPLEEVHGLLRRTGPMTPATDVIQMVDQFATGSRERATLAQAVAHLSLRASLRNAMQMLYQAARDGKPKILNDDNIFHVVKQSSHRSGEGIRVLAKAEIQGQVIQVGEIALIVLRDWPKGVGTKYYAMVTGLTSGGSEAVGLVDDVTLEILDANLNPHSYLLSQFEATEVR